MHVCWVVSCQWSKHTLFPYSRAEVSDRNLMQATCVILNFLWATLKRVEKDSEITFNNIQYIQNIVIWAWNQCKSIINVMFYILFLVLCLWCGLYCTFLADLTTTNRILRAVRLVCLLYYTEVLEVQSLPFSSATRPLVSFLFLIMHP